MSFDPPNTEKSNPYILQEKIEREYITEAKTKILLDRAAFEKSFETPRILMHEPCNKCGKCCVGVPGSYCILRSMASELGDDFIGECIFLDPPNEKNERSCSIMRVAFEKQDETLLKVIKGKVTGVCDNIIIKLTGVRKHARIQQEQEERREQDNT